jgi:hypothetical protein
VAVWVSRGCWCDLLGRCGKGWRGSVLLERADRGVSREGLWVCGWVGERLWPRGVVGGDENIAGDCKLLDIQGIVADSCTVDSWAWGAAQTAVQLQPALGIMLS